MHCTASAGEVYYPTSNSNYPTKNQNNRLTRSCARVVYIAGDSLRHQPMGTGHMIVLQFRGPITFCVLQWCHPMLTRTLWRTSCSARMIALYGDRKRIQARAQKLIVKQGLYITVADYREFCNETSSLNFQVRKIASQICRSLSQEEKLV